MLNAFHLGGWGMYPTLVFGIVLIGASIGYARKPERRRLPLLGILALLTFLAGSLGFVTGLMVTLSASADAPNQGALIAQGTFESLNNVGLALTLLILAGMVAVVGAFRSDEPRGGTEAVARRAHA